jgi:type IV pilus assembly protein PilA
MLARIRKSMEEKDEGFTLIELLVVIIIIGILAAIAIPVFLNQRKKGYDAQAKSDARNIATLEETWLTDNDVYIKGDPVTTMVTLGAKKSANVTSLDVKVYSDAAHGVVVATGAVGGYCITAVSNSTSSFYYDSAAGGFTNTACPAGL